MPLFLFVGLFVLYTSTVGSVHGECLVLQQDNKEKQPYKANYCNLTQHTVHLFSGVKKNSREQVYVKTLELVLQ